MEHTSNYELSKWAESDRIQMEDFNMDHDKIDAALAGSPRIAVGSYTGTGDVSQPVYVNTGFRPVAVLLSANGTNFENSAMLLTTQITTNLSPAELTDSGFVVYYKTYSGSPVAPYTNSLNTTYYYFAIG